MACLGRLCRPSASDAGSVLKSLASIPFCAACRWQLLQMLFAYCLVMRQYNGEAAQVRAWMLFGHTGNKGEAGICIICKSM